MVDAVNAGGSIWAVQEAYFALGISLCRKPETHSASWRVRLSTLHQSDAVPRTDANFADQPRNGEGVYAAFIDIARSVAATVYRQTRTRPTWRSQTPKLRWRLLADPSSKSARRTGRRSSGFDARW